MFMHFQTDRVPIARVIANLEQRLATNRENVQLIYQLARVHSMAYATNVSVIEVTQREGTPQFGYPGSDTGVPRIVTASATPGEQTNALRHLTNAIALYQRAGKLASKGTNTPLWELIPIRLGLAWTLDQAGRKQEAIEAYRDALEAAWRKEVDPELTFKQRAQWSWDQLRAGNNPLKKPLSRGYIGPGVCYSEEIIRYLLALLDPKKDAKEIAQLQADQKTLRSMPRAITPIIVPLRDDLAFNELVQTERGVAFDLDGSGEHRSWGWITTNAAWLVFDDNGKGQITSALQLFGNVTFWVFWRDGYDALSSLDDNGDGQISGPELAGLSLWCDRNGNGVSELGEVRPIVEFQIKAIDCRREVHSSGIPFSPRGVVFRDGTSRPTYDWIVPTIHEDAITSHGDIAPR